MLELYTGLIASLFVEAIMISPASPDDNVTDRCRHPASGVNNTMANPAWVISRWNPICLRSSERMKDQNQSFISFMSNFIFAEPAWRKGVGSFVSSIHFYLASNRWSQKGGTAEIDARLITHFSLEPEMHLEEIGTLER